MQRIVKTEFHAAHHIPEHPKCGKTHGHTYKLEVLVDIDGWVDFHDLKEIIWKVLKDFDHTDLGAKTSEDLIAELFDLLLEKFTDIFGDNLMALNLRLFETSEFGVAYP